ncbi:Fc receptor-like protein 5 [Poeciliopsis prolifica]|uniref:Fc receptor-like protein 5 n=1 Tax=Poeciliopsis prolifica TaxID=188132 RepID=UPI002414503C|nr:Fc receptor-like protein 5 [Poeciliopsis prolifica]
MTTISNEVTINKTVSNRVSVTSQPNWSQIYRDERITLRCEIQGGTDWTYEWRPTNGNSPSSSEYMSITATESDSGDYSCMGRRGYEFTGWSEAFRLTVSSDEPRATLTAENSIIPAGGSVTLSCSVDGSTDWEFDWFRNGRHYPASSGNTKPGGTIRVSEGGKYICRGRRRDLSFYSKTSEAVTIQKAGSKPTVILNPSSSLTEDKIHLECFMQKGPEWTYEWRKNNLDYNPTSRIITAESGDYSCRGKSDNLLTQWSDVITLTISPNKPSLILQPNWSQIYRGEEITLRCEIQGGTEYDWTYEWRPTNRNSPTSSEYMSIAATDSGDYSCRGIRGGFSLTSWSNVIKITVSSPPQPVLSVSPSWPNPGASVTLSCEGLELQSAGWRFFWYKAVPDPSKLNYGPSYTYELLPDSITGTEQNSIIINGPTQTAGYQCRAGRGEPKFYTRYSEVKFIWSADPGPAALSVNPDRVQHFRSDSVSLSCEGNFTEWRVMRFTETRQLSYFTCFIWGTMTGSTCTFELYYYNNGVYWCESKSGEFSNAVNITEQDDYYNGIILVSPVHPVTEGDPVTLSCRNKQQFLSNVFFYHNDKLINNDGREKLNISAVSKSDEGFYKCKHSGKESPRSWMSVRVTLTSSVSSSFPVLLIVGSVVGIVLIILIIVLILLWRCRRSRDLSSKRVNQPDSINPASATNHEVTQNDGSVYSSLLHGDTSLYETIPLNRGNERIHDPTEESDYANANPGNRKVMVGPPAGLAQGKGNAN